MTTDESILERLNALEKQNRWMKRIGAAVIMIAASLLVMVQKAAVNRTVQANEFVLRDSDGTVRSKWFMTTAGPELSLLDASGRDRVTFEVHQDGSPTISLWGPNGSVSITGPRIVLAGGGGTVDLAIAGGYSSLMFTRDKLDLMLGLWPRAAQDVIEFQMTNGGGRVSFDVSDSPSIRIQDKEGFEAAVGSTDPITERTGETHQTSAASVTLFSKDKKILWKAP
jgi:hypothetical protein